MAGTRLISIIGRKNAGKTTLTVTLGAEFVRRGKRVMTIKHGTHAADIDQPGTDSFRHFHEGHAERVMFVSPESRMLIERAPDNYDPIAIVKKYMADADVVLLEGYKRAPIPKIEVHRTVVGEPIYAADLPIADQWVALITDDLKLKAGCRVLHYTDTMWLQFLANLAWERALVVEG